MPKPYSKDHLNIVKLENLALRLGFPLSVLEKAAEKAEISYWFRKEPKSSGKGFRDISEPKYLLKKIQQSIHKLLLEIKVSDSAHCGIKKRSNLTNAKHHCKKQRLFSLDFKDYFPHISNNRVYTLFLHELNCTPEVASLLTRLCTVRRQVPQGGPMSMDIANLVCRELDKRMEGLTAKYGLVYTRHCDDINISGKAIPESFKKQAKKIIRQSGFPLNTDKESLTNHADGHSVVGLNVNRKKPNVARNTKREWRKEKYKFDQFEAHDLPEAEKIRREQKIKGRESYVKYIEAS